MSSPPDYAKLVPGFDFLQGLVKNAGSVLPGIGQWVAPTLDPAELDKRIEELRTVQFWLEQNARMLAATIQALEVQRMTLSTLQTMNVQVADLRDALQVQLPEAAAGKAAPAAAGAETAAPRAARKRGTAPSAAQTAKPAASAPAAAGGVVDPAQWWGALTQQFTQLAAQAMQDAGAAAAPARSAGDSAPATRSAAKAATPKPRGAPARKH